MPEPAPPPDQDDAAAHDLIRALPCWTGRIDIAPLTGGITNRNFRVRDGGRDVVVRLGGDIPVHGVLRFNEHAASRAAAAAGVSPPVRHAAPGVLVIDFIAGHSLLPAQVRADQARCVGLVMRAHREVARHLRGPALAFNVFHILRDYAHTIRSGESRHHAVLPRLAAIAATLEAGAGASTTVFGHNDLLAANIIDDGTRLWLIDWDYAGFGTPLFDLGGLSANNGFDPDDDARMLEAYFGAKPDAGLWRRFAAVACAARLREALWSMVSERHATLDFDYAAYSDANLAGFEHAWDACQKDHGA